MLKLSGENMQFPDGSGNGDYPKQPMIECPCCKSHSCTNFVYIERLPLIIFPVDESQKNEIPFEPISTFECQACSHVFRLPLSDDHQHLIYEELYRYYPFDKLETLSRVYRDPFER